MGWSGEEGLWLPEGALPFSGGGSGVASPTFGPGLGFPTPGENQENQTQQREHDEA